MNKKSYTRKWEIQFFRRIGEMGEYFKREKYLENKRYLLSGRKVRTVIFIKKIFLILLKIPG